jgi:hypothetical protein
LAESSFNNNTYDLLQLKASGYQALLADVQLANGTYEQVRLHISKVIVTDATGDHEAKLPSNDLKIVGVFEVGPNSTSTVNFDFAADRSLHTTGKGEYILAPVVRMQIMQNVQVEATNKENVKVQGGKLRTDTEVGMDIDGNVGTGKEIPANAPVSIVDGVITVTPPGTNETMVVKPGSPNYQACVNLCNTGGLGGGENCIDGCKGAESTVTKDTYWCEQLSNRATVPVCYGAVAKSLKDQKVCDNFTGKEKSSCMAVYISGSTG